MIRLLIDTSVLIKWFHSQGEAELVEARALRKAHERGDISAHVLDLALYEAGNVLVRALGWDARDVANQLHDLITILGTPLVMAPAWLPDAATLARTRGLTFYDAAWVAAARGLSITLVSADAKLLVEGLAESATVTSRRLGLLPP